MAARDDSRLTCIASSFRRLIHGGSRFVEADAVNFRAHSSWRRFMLGEDYGGLLRQHRRELSTR